MGEGLTTERLVVRDWRLDDAAAALAIYGVDKVTRWLTPAMGQVADEATMRLVLAAWIEAQPNMTPPRGRWAVERQEDGEGLGGPGIRLRPPDAGELELSGHL